MSKVSADMIANALFIFSALLGQVLAQECTYTPRMACDDGSWDMSYTGRLDGSTMCYKSIHWGRRKVSYDEARRMCQNQGADMAPVRNDQEYNTMKASVNRVWQGGVRRGQLYIGARDLSPTKSPVYYWVHDNSRVTYFRWANNQPSQGSGAKYGHDYERCVTTLLGDWAAMKLREAFEWNDTFCEGFVDDWFGIQGVVCAKKATLFWN